MLALLQRVSSASVRVGGDTVGNIGPGLLVFLGVQRGDDDQRCARLAGKVANYRLFADGAGRMNLSVRETGGAALVISQFTLAADTGKGLRPSFTPAAEPGEAERLYGYFVETLAAEVAEVRTGRFGADMQVELCNDGPVTFLLEA